MSWENKQPPYIVKGKEQNILSRKWGFKDPKANDALERTRHSLIRMLANPVIWKTFNVAQGNYFLSILEFESGWKEGAFTGELSADMLLDVGCKYVILGHSERRHILGESNADVNQKVLAALAAGLVPIVCVGETLEQREADKTTDVIGDQFEGSLAGVTAEQMANVVIAYEPVWAIGTGKTASPEQAEAVHLDIRKMLEKQYNSEVAVTVRIQYGGSVKPGNAAEP